MDQTDFRIAVTVVSFIAFVAILFWAYSRKSKPSFDVASRIPFETLEQAKQDEARESSLKSSKPVTNLRKNHHAN